jgi:hypothetical protein
VQFKNIILKQKKKLWFTYNGLKISFFNVCLLSEEKCFDKYDFLKCNSGYSYAFSSRIFTRLSYRLFFSLLESEREKKKHLNIRTNRKITLMTLENNGILSLNQNIDASKPNRNKILMSRNKYNDRLILSKWVIVNKIQHHFNILNTRN